MRPCACPRFPANPLCGAHAHARKQLQGALVGDQVHDHCSLCTLSFPHRVSFTACGRASAGFAQNWRSVRRSFAPCPLRMHARRTPPRTNRHQHAVVTICRAGGLPFVPTVANNDSCRVALGPGQHLARGIGFLWLTGIAPPPDLVGNAQYSCTCLLCWRRFSHTRKCSASVSVAAWALAANRTLNSSFTLEVCAQVLASPVARREQRGCWRCGR
jgi:hypothetical protein